MIQPAERAAADRNERSCNRNGCRPLPRAHRANWSVTWVPSRWIGTPPQTLCHRALRALLVGQAFRVPGV